MARTDPKRFLHGAVGAGDLDNRPEDVVATKRLLRDMGLYQPRPEGLGDDIDAGFDAALRRFQKERGLVEDGTLLPGGETERNLVAARSGEGLDPGPSPGEIRPRGTVGEGGENDPETVAMVKRAFGALGRYPYDRTRPPPPYIDAKLVDAIRDLQHESGIHPDGRIDPEGKTVDALRRAVATQHARQKTLPNGKRLRPGETQVAVAPVLAAAVPPLLGLMARAAPHLARGGGAAAGAAAGQAAIEAGKTQESKSEIMQNPPPSSPPPYPAHQRNPKHNINVSPADGPKMPDRTETLIGTPVQPIKLIYQALDDDEFRRQIMIVERAGGERTRKLNDLVGKLGVEIGGKLGRELTMSHGGYHKDGNYQSEYWLKPQWPLADPSKPLANGSWLDVVLTLDDGKSKILINTVDIYRKDGRLKPREERQRVKVMINKNENEIFITIPKPHGEVNLEEYVKQFEPALKDAIKRLSS